MLIKEEIKLDGRDFVKHYSDDNKYIHKIGTNEGYVEAIDLPDMNFEYEETDKEIEKNEEIIVD